MVFVFLFLLISTCFSLEILGAFSLSASLNQRKHSKLATQQRIYQAIALSKDAQSNITAAYLATSAWKRLLQGELLSVVKSDSKEAPISLEARILVMCQGLYASTLTRIGRDENGENNRQ